MTKIGKLPIAALFSLWPHIATPASAAMISEIGPTEQIPPFYESWSLFLVCNPEWILNEGDEGISVLYQQFRAYGAAIGNDNVAIWFWKTWGDEPTVENTDINRMSGYCKKFGLMPSETPQVVTTTRYPDYDDVGDRVVANLNGDGKVSSHALAILADQLLKTGLSQENLDTRDGWSRVVRAAKAAVNSAGCYFNKVTISVKTVVVNAEIGHSSDSSCP